MFKRFWTAAIVSIGVALLIGQQGYAQQEADPAEPTPPIEQAAAPELPNPLPVIVIEEVAAAQARARREGIAHKHQSDELIVQQEMNAAAQSTKHAAWASVVLVLIGTILLWWTLALTRKANKAAQDAVQVTREVGQAQTRAYLAFRDLHIDVAPANSDDPLSRSISYSFEIENLGNTPALNIKWTAVIEEFVLSEVDQQRTFFPKLKERTKGKNLTRIDVGNLPATGAFKSGEKARANHKLDQLTDDQIDRLGEVTVVFAIALRVAYEDIFAPNSPVREVVAFASCRQTPSGAVEFHRLEKYDEQN